VETDALLACDLYDHVVQRYLRFVFEPRFTVASVSGAPRGELRI
jgi:hypothetical protein